MSYNACWQNVVSFDSFAMLRLFRLRDGSASRSAVLLCLGHSEQELQRLGRQGQALGPFTRQLFEEAGIGRGMRVLDVGCGSGDVAFLAADLVGLSGEVVGVDRERTAVDWANARAYLRGTRNVNFIEGDPAEMDLINSLMRSWVG